MPFLPANPAPSREAVDALPGATLIEFGTSWCGYCQAARPRIDAALAELKTPLRHIQIEDGKGRQLGRTFGVKLWPTLIVLQDGAEVARVVRPASAEAVGDALRTLSATDPAAVAATKAAIGDGSAADSA